MTMLIAGHETTAAVLTWTMHCLTDRPDVLKRLQHEVPYVLCTSILCAILPAPGKKGGPLGQNGQLANISLVCLYTNQLCKRCTTPCSVTTPISWRTPSNPTPMQIDEVLGDRKPTLDDLKKLRFTMRVINEAMRLYPQPPVLIRRAVEDDVLGGFSVAAGSDIFISVWNIHR